MTVVVDTYFLMAQPAVGGKGHEKIYKVDKSLILFGTKKPGCLRQFSSASSAGLVRINML